MGLWNKKEAWRRPTLPRQQYHWRSTHSVRRELLRRGGAAARPCSNAHVQGVRSASRRDRTPAPPRPRDAPDEPRNCGDAVCGFKLVVLGLGVVPPPSFRHNAALVSWQRPKKNPTGEVGFRLKKKPGDDLLSRDSSTIGAEELNFRVRDGNGWDLFAMITRRLLQKLLRRILPASFGRRPSSRT